MSKFLHAMLFEVLESHMCALQCAVLFDRCQVLVKANPLMAVLQDLKNLTLKRIGSLIKHNEVLDLELFRSVQDDFHSKSDFGAFGPMGDVLAGEGGEEWLSKYHECIQLYKNMRFPVDLKD